MESSYDELSAQEEKGRVQCKLVLKREEGERQAFSVRRLGSDTEMNNVYYEEATIMKLVVVKFLLQSR